MRDCRNCRHNTYLDVGQLLWVLCGHPVTLAKTPKADSGDPAFVAMRTGDLRVENIADVANCPTWEAL